MADPSWRDRYKKVLVSKILLPLFRLLIKNRLEFQKRSLDDLNKPHDG